MTFLTINNIILNTDKIIYVIQDGYKVKVYFEVGEPLVFEGPESAALWKLLDPDAGDWRGEK